MEEVTILVPFHEWKRLRHVEEQYNELLKSQSPNLKHKFAKADESEADNLKGAGPSAAANAEAANAPVVKVVVPKTDVPQVLVKDLPTDFFAPDFVPLIDHAHFQDFSLQMRQDQLLDKSVPLSIPLNNVLGATDPSVPAGHAPMKQVNLSQSEIDRQGHILSGKVKKAQVLRVVNAFFLGSSSEDDDDN